MALLTELTVVLMVVSATATNCTSGEMTVTGGGVVRLGQNVTITLCLDEGETCDKSKWTLNHEGTVTQCRVGNGEIRCKPSDESFKSLLHPVVTEDNTCVMDLPDISPALSGTWEGDSNWSENTTMIIIHENVTSLDISVRDEGKLEAGLKSPVSCTVEGGTPTPDIRFMLMEDDTEVQGSEERFTNLTSSEIGGVLTVRATLTPEEGDAGRQVCCHAEQWDESTVRQSLATIEKMTAGLDILFPPRNLKIKQDHKNESHLVNVSFESNPPPSAGNVSFTVQRTGCEEGQESACVPVTVVPGTLNMYLNASALRNKTGHFLETSLVISGLTDWDWLDSAVLTINIDNGLGKIEEETSIELDPSFIKKVLEKRNMVGGVVVVVLLLVLAITGGIIYQKKRQGQIEREPLTNGPSMSSLEGK